MATNFDLKLIIAAVDKASAPLRKFTSQLKALTSPIRSVQKDLDAFGKAAGFEKLGEGFAGFGGAIRNVASETFALAARFAGLAAAGGLALYSLVKGQVDAGDELSTIAERVGMTVDQFASLRYAADQADVSQESFNDAMDKFSKNLGAAKAGGGDLYELLQKVAPNLAENFKNSKNASVGLALMTDAFERIKDPAKRARLATAAFGRSGAQMGVFLGQGREEVRKTADRFFELAGSQVEFANTASTLDNVLKDVRTAFAGLLASGVTPLMPAIGELAKAVTGFIVENRQGIADWAREAGAEIMAWVKGGGIPRLIADLKSLGKTVSEAIDFVGGFKGVLMIVGAYMASGLVTSILAVIPAVYALGAALLTTPIGWITLGLAAIAGAAYLVYRDWDAIGPQLTKLWQGLGDSIAGLVTTMTALLHGDGSGFVDGLTQSFEGLEKVLESINALLNEIPTGIRGALAPFANTLGGGMLAGPLAAADANKQAQSGNLLSPSQAWTNLKNNFSGGPAQQANVKLEITAPKGARVSVDPDSDKFVDVGVTTRLGG